jgi:hypothetical protein
MLINMPVAVGEFLSSALKNNFSGVQKFHFVVPRERIYTGKNPPYTGLEILKMASIPYTEGKNTLEFTYFDNFPTKLILIPEAELHETLKRPDCKFFGISSVFIPNPLNTWLKAQQEYLRPYRDISVGRKKKEVIANA